MGDERNAKIARRQVRREIRDLELTPAVLAFFRPRPRWCPRRLWIALVYLPLLACVRREDVRYVAARLSHRDNARNAS